MTPAANLGVLGAATRRLLSTVEGLTDDQAREPSRLPGWNRAEVLTHLARNADGTRRMVQAAARGEIAAQYPGGPEERAKEIEAGRDATAAESRADVWRSHDAMMEAWRALPDDAWERVGRAISGDRSMREVLWSRVREIELHHVDLDMGYEPTDWPVGFVAGALDDIFGTFGRRASSGRPLIDAGFRVVSTDHERAWHVALRGTHVDIEPVPGDEPDGEARGWGCDLVAWLYGRDPQAAGIIVSGDASVLRLPQWFPFA
ncbi:MAG TPA: maleylpyruvate isomerase N-terminal domain-containing protein [Acidimicrobiia bacterium]|nr:maleylpyruvate isomerase N-terminal domain-containing protein [Acidimicrobiia bacterium]